MALVMVFGTLAMTVTAAEATASTPLVMIDNHDVSAGGTAGYSASNIKTAIPYDAIPFSSLGMNAPVKGESYVIKTADELVLFSQNVNAKNDYRGVTVYLGADIDMSGKTMDPIGNSTAAFGSTLSAPYFKGVFDGQQSARNTLLEEPTRRMKLRLLFHAYTFLLLASILKFADGKVYKFYLLANQNLYAFFVF